MSLPHIPDMQPKVELRHKDVVNMLLASIAMEEMALSHILNAEGEKLQKALSHNPCIREMLEVNRSVERVLKGTIKKELLLQMKLEDVLEAGCHEHYGEEE